MKVGKLILTSGGVSDGGSGEELDALVESISKQKNVLFINNATITGSNANAPQSIMQKFKSFGKDAKWYYDIKKGSKPKYDVSLKTYKCLGFVKENIYPHYNKATEEMKQKAKIYSEQNTIKITPLEDGEWIEYATEKLYFDN